MANEELAKITGGGYTINLVITSISHVLDKQLMIFPMPNKGASDTLTWLVDIARLKEAVTIQGYILPSSTSSGYAQKTVLINLMRDKSFQPNLTLAWGKAIDDSSTYASDTMNGNIQKADIKEETGRVGGYTTGETKRYNVQLVFVRGTHKG